MLNSRTMTPALSREPSLGRTSQLPRLAGKQVPRPLGHFSLRPGQKFWQQTTTFYSPEAPAAKTPAENLPEIGRLESVTDDDRSLREDIKNVDMWVFENILKGKFLEQGEASRDPIEKFLRNRLSTFLPDLDVKMIDQILYPRQSRGGGQPVEGGTDEMGVTQNSMSAEIIQKKIAVTSETINNEYNKVLMINLVRKKLDGIPGSSSWSASDFHMYAKVILLDFISSFKVLRIFKHHNMAQMREQLVDCRRALNSALVHSKPQDLPHRRSPVSLHNYEQALMDNYNQILREIAAKKLVPDDLRLAKTQARGELNAKQMRLAELIREHDKRELQYDFKRKAGEPMNISDYMELNELKNRYVALKAEMDAQEAENRQKFSSIDETTLKIDAEIRDLGFKKRLFLIKMQEFYLALLGSEEDLLATSKTVIGVILSLWSLKAEIKMENFPRVMRPRDVEFALQFAQRYKNFLKVKLESDFSKKNIREKFAGLFQNILMEKESAKIEYIHRTISHMKKSHLRVFQKSKPSKHSPAPPPWEEIKTQQTLSLARHRESKVMREEFFKQNFDPSCFEIPSLSEELCALKEEFIREAVVRAGQIEGGHVALADSPYLKKLFVILFGVNEAQVILSEVRKERVFRIK